MTTPDPTDADREAATAVDKMLACGCPGFIASIEKLFAAHRIAAAKAEQEKCGKIIEPLVRELDAWNTNVEKIIGRPIGYRWNALEAARELIDQLTKGPDEMTQHKPIPTDDERAALLDLFRAWQRLKELGWKEAMYAKHGSQDLTLIEVGSTGIHPGFRDADGSFWRFDGETYPSNPILYRETDKLFADCAKRRTQRALSPASTLAKVTNYLTHQGDE